jgi:hypothetical protein
MTMTKSTPHHEPTARGKKKSTTKAPAYGSWSRSWDNTLDAGIWPLVVMVPPFQGLKLLFDG